MEALRRPGIQANFGNDMLHIGGLKGFADGSLGSTTAWLFKPYARRARTPAASPSDELSEPDQMYANIRDADKAGLQVAIHAIGDRANNTILNFYERVEKENGPWSDGLERRFRIEHAQHLLPTDIPRFASLHVIASMQPYHCIDDGRWAAKTRRRRTAQDDAMPTARCWIPERYSPLAPTGRSLRWSH